MIRRGFPRRQLCVESLGGGPQEPKTSVGACRPSSAGGALPLTSGGRASFLEPSTHARVRDADRSPAPHGPPSVYPKRAHVSYEAPAPHTGASACLSNPPELARLVVRRLPRSALKFRAGHRGITNLMTSMRFGKEFIRGRPIESRYVIGTRQKDDELVLVNLDDHASQQ
jgi:hypothetical protein